MSNEPAANTNTGAKVVIRNIGLLLSGDLAKPILDADAVVVKDGRVSAIGKEKELDCEGATSIIDANGAALLAWRRDHDDFGGRSTHAGAAEGCGRPEGTGDHGATYVCGIAAERSESAGGSAGD
jgi:hypothetical protein